MIVHSTAFLVDITISVFGKYVLLIAALIANLEEFDEFIHLITFSTYNTFYTHNK